MRTLKVILITMLITAIITTSIGFDVVAASEPALYKQVVDSDGDVGSYTSMVLDSDGYPHISYFDYRNSDGVKYTKWDGDGKVWQVERETKRQIEDCYREIL